MEQENSEKAIKVPENTWSVWRTKEPEAVGLNTTVNNLVKPDDAMLKQHQISGQNIELRTPKFKLLEN